MERSMCLELKKIDLEINSGQVESESDSSACSASEVQEVQRQAKNNTI
jgi:hypothetical protein